MAQSSAIADSTPRPRSQRCGEDEAGRERDDELQRAFGLPNGDALG